MVASFLQEKFYGRFHAWSGETVPGLVEHAHTHTHTHTHTH